MLALTPRPPKSIPSLPSSVGEYLSQSMMGDINSELAAV